MKRIPLLVLIAVISALAIACSRSSGGGDAVAPVATGTSPEASATASSTSGVTPSVPTATDTAPMMPGPGAGLAAVSLPARPVQFRVRIPENTPADDGVYVMVHSVDIGSHTAHIQLQPEGEGIYSGEVTVPEGGMVRYAYDRWDEQGCCEARYASREALFTGDHTGYRLLVVEPDIQVVEDVVPQWNDLERDFEQAEVSGIVADAVSGEPLMDVEVTVGGVHVASQYDGTFTVPGVAPGPQTLVAYTVKGDYSIEQLAFDLEAGGLTGIELRLTPTKTERVEFVAQLPAGTPPDAAVFIAGNLWQLGGRPAGPNQPAVPSGLSMPMMDRNGDIASLTLDLPVGAYVEYFYTLGADVVAESLGVNRLFRSFVAGEDHSTRNEVVSHWGNEGWPLVTIRADVPANTPDGVPVFLRTGPSFRMNRTGPNQWVTVYGSHPPGSEFTYTISLGDDIHGIDGSPETGESGTRVVKVPEESIEINVKVRNWLALPDPTMRDGGNGLTVTFRLSVPPDTPEGATVILSGDRAAVGTNGTAMRPVAGNPWLYEVEINFGHDGPLRYRYTVAESGFSSGELTVGTDFHGQVVNDFVTSWSGTRPSPREGWASGIFTPDFWSEAFLPASASTFDAAVEANGEWVAISSVWSFGQIQPEPFVESRPVRIWTVLTPIEDIRAQAAIAREKGLKIFLAPQMNPEVHPGWQDETVSAGSREWWEQWLVQAEAQWMWNALVGEEIGAEMLMLPGYVFHVFPPPFFFLDEDYVPEFDLKVQELIRNVRKVYSGKILISGSQTGYDFPGLADYVGVTTYYVGVPELPADAHFSEFQDHYAERFKERVDPMWERWGKPVMFYTIHAPSKAQTADEHGQLFQAAAYEAMYQQIAARPFVTGSFTWAWDMVGASHFLADSVRDRTAEAVMAKWYALLGGN